MLVLTRKMGERIQIGDDIDVTVLEISGHRVRLGFTAPKDISIHREEILRRIRYEMANPVDELEACSHRKVV